MTIKTSKANRRDFLKLISAAGGGLVLAVYLDGCAPQVAPSPTILPQLTATPSPTPRPPVTWSPDIYLTLDDAGLLTVTAFRSEMGQGIRTALAMLAADEADVDWQNVRIVQAPADAKYGDQVTGGSVSLSTYHHTLRTAGATMRQVLINAAAQAWDVDPTQCTSEPDFVVHPDGQQKLAYAELVESAAALSLPSGVKLKDSSAFRIIGTDKGHWDTPNILTGKAIYGLDIRLPNMVYAAIARCPVFGGTVTTYDDSAAKAVPGVQQVVQLEDRVAVVADNSWAAIRGRNALKIDWDEGSNANLSFENMVAAIMKRVPTPPAGTLQAVYQIPYEAHATMEPMNCVAYFHDDTCELWAPTQSPQDVQRNVALSIGLSPSQVQVNVPLLGGGFGRRLQTDYAQEAARLSKAIHAPVQVLWTRDDDLQHDYYHPMNVQYLRMTPERLSLPYPANFGGAGVPTGAWRSVENFPQAYGIQCFIDEMALALKRDPLELRLELYKNNERALGVLNLVAEKAGWGAALSDGHAQGLAYHATFSVTHVAYVAEVSVAADGTVRVHKVTAAVDCGQVINPDNVAAQTESGIVFGLTAALKAQATLKNGRMTETNFSDYPLLRMSEMPEVEVHLVDSDRAPSGMGEMGVPPIAPAVANAVFAATGLRVRHIPIRPEDLKA